MNVKKEIPEKFTNHFNEMKELIFNKNIKSEKEFIEKGKEINIKHFGHEGLILENKKP